jgi:hypothetical protein
MNTGQTALRSIACFRLAAYLDAPLSRFLECPGYANRDRFSPAIADGFYRKEFRALCEPGK